MVGAGIERFAWELTGWDSDDRAVHVTDLTRDEVLSVRDLFPRGEDELLATAVY
ncbi:hypothetical protein ACFT9I_02460 [Streptomyces sp. NPDC057137]|uniref:hypothetical protein n=1 Tax=Streptomyces sp. NPDC057137 TaxID=3346030 RepID=UPI003644A45C